MASKLEQPTSRPIRVLHCPFNVAGNPQGLAVAERELGLESWNVCCTPNRTHVADEQLGAEGDGLLRRQWQRCRVLARALRSYDVIHFNFGSPLFPVWYPPSSPQMRGKGRLSRTIYSLQSRLLEFRDLQLLKRAGVGIVFTYQGDDARQGDYCRKNFEVTFANEVGPEYYEDTDDRNKARVIARIGEFADRIYAVNPDLLHVLPSGSRFVPYSSVDPRKWRMDDTPAGTENRRPVVVHAPTHRTVKGTKYLLEAVRRLQEEDRLDFEFLLVEGLTQVEAAKLYRRADLLVDQLLAGWYGALAVELMSLGKPVVSYVRDTDLVNIPAQMRADLPIISATPQTIYTVLKSYLTTERHQLAEVGRRGRAYVERWHDPLKIAQQLKLDYEAIVAQPTHRRSRGRTPERTRDLNSSRRAA